MLHDEFSAQGHELVNWVLSGHVRYAAVGRSKTNVLGALPEEFRPATVGHNATVALTNTELRANCHI